MENTSAVVFGTFAPMHKGHIHLIQKAKRQHQNVIVIVSGYADDRGDKIGLPLQKRYEYVRELFANDKLVDVYKLDETHIPRYPDGWTPWLVALAQEAELKHITQDGTKQVTDSPELVFYVSEPEYKEELETRGFKAVCGERQYDISATKIRENPRQHWNMIAQTFQRHFLPKVLVIGSASNGKTTLCNDLGRYYNAGVSLEYARKYQIENGVPDDLLTAKDFYWLILGQFEQTSKLIDGRENNGLVIADTDAIVTKAYFDWYIKTDEETVDQKAFYSLFEAFIAKEKWDLILFVKPNGDYVDDGFRDMTMANQKARHDFSGYVDDLRKLYLPDVPTVYLDQDYYGNYLQAIAAIDQIL